VTVEGRRVAVAEYGDPEGDPLVLFHGTPGSRLFSALFDEAGRERGLRVLAPDRPGYGRSEPWPDRALADAAPLATGVADAAGADTVRVAGFSGGGPHALAAAAERPGRVSSVDVIAGAAPPALRGSPPLPLRALEAVAERTPRLLGATLSLGRHAPDGAAVSQYATADGHPPDDVAAAVGRDFRTAFANGGTGFVAETRLLASAWDDLLDRVERPVRLWHGDSDENVPLAGARRVADRLPDADLTVLDGADHLRTLLRARDRIPRE